MTERNPTPAPATLVAIDIAKHRPMTFEDLDEWWVPFTLGVGPVGDYLRGLDDDRRAALREHCGDLLPPAPFTVTGSAWTVVGRS